MYSIFKDDVVVFLTDNDDFLNNSEVLEWSIDNLDRVVSSLQNDEGQSFVLRGPNLKLMWRDFRARFKLIEAAGGLVINEQQECLFIFRNDTWDLPKGKIDPGESAEEAAIREVREECGFTTLEIRSRIRNTYHIYEHKGRLILKVTYWFIMYSDQKDLKPQLEEGITDLAWHSLSDLQNIFQNTYPNIKVLLSEEGLS